MLFLILIVKYIFRFRFRPKMAGLFLFRLFFGWKRKFIFRLFLFYGRKSKIHFRSASNQNPSRSLLKLPTLLTDTTSSGNIFHSLTTVFTSGYN